MLTQLLQDVVVSETIFTQDEGQKHELQTFSIPVVEFLPDELIDFLARVLLDMQKRGVLTCG